MAAKEHFLLNLCYLFKILLFLKKRQLSGRNPES